MKRYTTLGTASVSDRKFGVEIEFVTANVNNHVLAAKITEAGVPCFVEGYNHTTRAHWKIVTDGSCGYELVSPPMSGAEGLEQVRRVCKVLNEHGARVDSRCGLHVHHDAAGMNLQTWKNFLKLYSRHEDSLDWVMPASRRNSVNTYCRSIVEAHGGVDGTFTKIDQCRSLDELERRVTFSDRYYKVNLTAYARHRTVEVRHHSGTTDYEKIANWVRLTQMMLLAAAGMSRVSSGNANWQGLFGSALKGTAPDEVRNAVSAFYVARGKALEAR